MHRCLLLALQEGCVFSCQSCLARAPLCRRWAYNANSGDTGGLVADDWVTLNWEKLQWLQDTLGLQSWYML